VADGRVSEYAFELALCARLEREDRVVARQLGGGVAAPGRRVVDVVAVEPGPAFDDRARITDETIPPSVVEGAVGAGRAVRASEAVDAPPERRTAVLDRAVDVGFVEAVDGVRYRQRVRYPDGWFADLLAVENKPDLGRPGDMERQLRYDASLALFDRVVLATASHVTRAHLNRLPEPVGVWRFDPATGERRVVRRRCPSTTRASNPSSATPAGPRSGSSSRRRSAAAAAGSPNAPTARAGGPSRRPVPAASRRQTGARTARRSTASSTRRGTVRTARSARRPTRRRSTERPCATPGRRGPRTRRASRASRAASRSSDRPVDGQRRLERLVGGVVV